MRGGGRRPAPARALWAMLGALAILACGACAGEPEVVRPPLLPSTAPAPATPAPPALSGDGAVVDGDVTVATVAGIRVLVKRIPGAEFAAGQLYVRGGTRNWTAANAGIEQLAFDVASSGGTKSLDKTAYSRKLASLGAHLHASARNDFSVLYGAANSNSALPLAYRIAGVWGGKPRAAHPAS